MSELSANLFCRACVNFAVGRAITVHFKFDYRLCLVCLYVDQRNKVQGCACLKT